MYKQFPERRLIDIRAALIRICNESGVLVADDIERSFSDDLIETGMVDSIGIVCLQDQISTNFNIFISVEHFVAELRTLEKLVNYLATNSAVQLPA